MLPRPYLVGLVGAGVGPSLTPTIHMLEARALGLDYVYRTVDLTAWGVPPSEIGTLLHYAAALGYDALNITHPCKQLVVEHLDRVAEQAARLGAVNTVLFSGGATTGYNTDQRGFATALATELPGAAKDVVVQLGAGGAGAAVADALLESGVEHLILVDRDEDKAVALAAQLAGGSPTSRVEASQPDKLPVLIPAADGLVHCTPTGMADHPGTPTGPDAAACRSSGWPTSFTGLWRPLCCMPPERPAAASCTADTWSCTRPPIRSGWSLGASPMLRGC